MSPQGAPLSSRLYWAGVGVYVVVMLLVQSVMGLGIDRFKELWGVEALEIVAYVIVGIGAGAVVAMGWKVWALCSAAERAWVAVALFAYAVGTSRAGAPQERLHYLGYGLLGMLLYFGATRDGGGGGWKPTARAAIAALVLGGLIGLADELLQILWPRRYFDWVDVRMNVVAVGLGLLVAIPVGRARARE